MINKYEKELNFSVYSELPGIDKGILKAGNFSVSKVNIIVSLFIFISWISLFILSTNNFKDCTSVIIGITTLFLVILMTLISKSKI